MFYGIFEDFFQPKVFDFAFFSLTLQSYIPLLWREGMEFSKLETGYETECLYGFFRVLHPLEED